MKTILTSIGVLLTGLSLFAQGIVLFGNSPGGINIIRAPIYGVEPDNPTLAKQGNGPAPSIPAGTQVYRGPLLAGTGYTCQLWGHVGAGLPESALELLATTTFRTGTAAGFINVRSVAVPNAPIDGTPYFGTFQVRAWDNQGGAITTWAQVEAANAFPFVNPVPAGKSFIFTPPERLGGTGTPSAPTPGLIGLESFNLYIVPEPSVLALGVLGGGWLVVGHWCRRASRRPSAGASP